ncbi:hypothetical protein FOXG_04686 [Fusarium oxysporum f. sp. lycopersici 4287]|nr:hypothetical protein FOXG_04686 [Fusarium oxysporum f. sp. lycopersici 4287]EXK43445.1 hypothetical protein FOMG_02401 [Fusarium oxysporum f. sp. melonis 26406]KNB01443.1 hypothetical protein FOXG_04686 [Fusarium oxysporum f. sp. lycopersici 4287]
MFTFAIPLTDEKAARLRTLTQKLKDDELREAFTRRADTAGYTAETMHLQPMPDGSTILLVHLEFEGSWTDLQKRIIKYPDASFDEWWTDEWMQIARYPGPPDTPGIALPQPEKLFIWKTGGYANTKQT